MMASGAVQQIAAIEAVRVTARLISVKGGVVALVSEIVGTVSSRTILFKPQAKHRHIPNQRFSIPTAGIVFRKDSL